MAKLYLLGSDNPGCVDGHLKSPVDYEELAREFGTHGSKYTKIAAVTDFANGNDMHGLEEIGRYMKHCKFRIHHPTEMLENYSGMKKRPQVIIVDGAYSNWQNFAEEIHGMDVPDGHMKSILGMIDYHDFDTNIMESEPFISKPRRGVIG